MLNKQAKRIAAVVMAAAMVFTVAPVVTPQAVTAEAAAKKTVKLSKTSLKITQNKGYKLSVKNTSKKAEIKWSSSDKKVVTVKASKNKKSATVKPVATTGSAIVTAKVGKKKYNCKVSVSIAQKANRFNELVNTVASKGVDQTFNIAGYRFTRTVYYYQASWHRHSSNRFSHRSCSDRFQGYTHGRHDRQDKHHDERCKYLRICYLKQQKADQLHRDKGYRRQGN